MRIALRYYCTLFLIAVVMALAPFGAALAQGATVAGGITTAASSTTGIVATIVAVLLPIVNTYAYEGLQKILGFLDRLSPILKTLIALLLPIPLNLLADALKIPHLPGDLHGWTADTTLGLLQGLAAIGLHAKQSQAIKSSTALNPIT